MKPNEKMVLDTSDEAASIKTVTGWVSRTGRFWGDDERMARYDGSTHKQCECGRIAEKSYIRCEACRSKADIEKFKARPVKVWDSEAFLYSDAHDKYFQDLESLIDYLSDYDEDDKYTLEDLRLIICEPNMAREVESDFWCDDLPEDGDLPSEMAEALRVFNEVVRRAPPLSWSPGKYAADVDAIKAAIGPMELFSEPVAAMAATQPSKE